MKIEVKELWKTLICLIMFIWKLFEGYDSRAINEIGIYKFQDFLSALKKGKTADESIPMYKNF